MNKKICEVIATEFYVNKAKSLNEELTKEPIDFKTWEYGTYLTFTLSLATSNGMTLSIQDERRIISCLSKSLEKGLPKTQSETSLAIKNLTESLYTMAIANEVMDPESFFNGGFVRTPYDLRKKVSNVVNLVMIACMSYWFMLYL